MSSNCKDTGQEEDEASVSKPERFMKLELRRIKDHWSEFCNVTSVHGLRYLVAYERPIYERLWWTSIVATSLYFASVYAVELCSRWLNSPIEHTTATKYNTIVDIPFPAITFCNNMKAAADKKFENELKFLCGLEEMSEQDNNTLSIDDMIDMAPPFVHSCRMVHNYSQDRDLTTTNCRKMFTRILTENGICYTMNMMDATELFREEVISHFSLHHRKSDWDPEKGYKKDAKFHDRDDTSEPFLEGPYPKRGSTSVIIDISFRSLFNGTFCVNDLPGLKVAIHNPQELPVTGNRMNTWILVSDNNKEAGCLNCLSSEYQYAIEIDPERTWVSTDQKIFMPHQRKCYFSGERYLSYFKFYTQSNCENECLINDTLKKCGCADFYMPRFNATKVCELKDLSCIMETLDAWRRKRKKNCGCYPSCNTVKYNNYIWAKNGSAGHNKSIERDAVTIEVYLAEYVYVSREHKQSQWTIVDLIASCGGVFGLFCGMSLIGVVEFIYYGTIRVATNLCRSRRKKIYPDELQPNSTNNVH